MKLHSRLHQLTSIPDDAWIFQGGRPERIQRFASGALTAFNVVVAIAAAALLLTYWIVIFATA